jgi:hypothetical protein
VCYCKNMKKGPNGEKVNWLKVKWIRVTKESGKTSLAFLFEGRLL